MGGSLDCGLSSLGETIWLADFDQLLQFTDLHCLIVTVEEPRKVRDLIAGLPGLRTLTLYDVDLGLRSLDMYYMRPTWPEGLLHLDLDRNPIGTTARGVAQLVAGLERTPALKTLRLTKCQIGRSVYLDEFLALLPTPVLEVLHAAGNRFGGTIPLEPGEQCALVEPRPSLRRLVLDDNSIGDGYGDVDRLVALLPQLPSLSTLELDDNDLADMADMKAILDATPAKKVTASSNRLPADHVRTDGRGHVKLGCQFRFFFKYLGEHTM